MTLFKHTLTRLGLSLAEAAAFLDVRLDTLKSWSSGRNPVPDGVWSTLAELAQKQEEAAQAMAEVWLETGEPDLVDFGLASDAHEAQSLGWPCVGAHMTVASIFWEMTGVEPNIVPRGSSLASAAASDIHDQTRKSKK